MTAVARRVAAHRLSPAAVAATTPHARMIAVTAIGIMTVIVATPGIVRVALIIGENNFPLVFV